jgi:cation:H+ antiporter
MHASVDPRKVLGNWLGLLLAMGASVPWSLLHLLGSGHGMADMAVAGLAGASILGAAFLLSWAVEAAEMDVPQALAVSGLALIAVLPEYAVDATFAWKAAHDPVQAGFAVANMTGGNRLLLGLGWSVLVFIAWGRFGKPGIGLPATTRVDVAVLFIASLYALVPIARGAITLVDTGIYLALYAAYVVAAVRVDDGSDDDDDGGDHLVGPAALLGAFSPWVRRAGVLLLLGWAGAAIFLAAEPFAESLVHTGKSLGIDEFLLVQWLAPLASEAPEFAVAALLVLRGHLSKGMLTLVSSKVNQWTLLIGTLPVVTSISAGEVRDLPFDLRQQEEVLLTAAQSLFGVAVISNLHLSRVQAIVLAALFALQLFVPGMQGRFIFAVAYLVGAVAIYAARKQERQGLLDALRTLGRALAGRRG